MKLVYKDKGNLTDFPLDRTVLRTILGKMAFQIREDPPFSLMTEIRESTHYEALEGGEDIGGVIDMDSARGSKPQRKRVRVGLFIAIRGKHWTHIIYCAY